MKSAIIDLGCGELTKLDVYNDGRIDDLLAKYREQQALGFDDEEAFENAVLITDGFVLGSLDADYSLDDFAEGGFFDEGGDF